jgi:hypothetical protein
LPLVVVIPGVAASVAAAQAGDFAKTSNKIGKILKIFAKID